MHALFYLKPRHVLALSLHLQELIENRLEFLNYFYLLEKLFEFVDSHGRNRNNFFLLLRVLALVLVILGVVHFIEGGKELIELFADEEMSEYIDLILCPYVIQGGDKGMRIFADLFNRGDLFLDVVFDVILYVLPHHLVNLDFLFGGKFELFIHVIEMSGWWDRYILSYEWLVNMLEWSLLNLSSSMVFILFKY